MNNLSRQSMYKKYRENIKEQTENEEKTSKQKMLENLAKKAGVKQKRDEEER